jgi:hypothetical protein
MHKSLLKVLSNLLLMRIKADDAPCSSDQHWCDAIAELINLLPDYKTNDAEFAYELKYIELNQKLVHGLISADDAEKEIEPYQIAAENASLTFMAFLQRKERAKHA